MLVSTTTLKSSDSNATNLMELVAHPFEMRSWNYDVTLNPRTPGDFLGFYQNRDLNSTRNPSSNGSCCIQNHLLHFWVLFLVDFYFESFKSARTEAIKQQFRIQLH